MAGGGASFDPTVAPRVLAGYRSLVAPARRKAQRLDQLTHREHDVLRLLSRARPTPRSPPACTWARRR